mmetsp:Transcript_20666/g.25379  ORF Transcript_20666/g.25379 Transcript_20666/m.25379 type:complete len:103 (-) Transcript_20666:59-367(-)
MLVLCVHQKIKDNVCHNHIPSDDHFCFIFRAKLGNGCILNALAQNQILYLSMFFVVISQILSFIVVTVAFGQLGSLSLYEFPWILKETVNVYLSAARPYGDF